MCVVRATSWFRGGSLFIVQMPRAISSAAVVSALFPGDFFGANDHRCRKVASEVIIH